MVQLIDSDIQTREVLDWRGLHLLHHPASSCSKKTRIFLNVKGIDWESNVVDIFGGENYGEWFLGINPRGLVPVLVDDGAVHIESNDILMVLEQKFPEPSLIPAGGKSEMEVLLKHEDDLHLDLRTLSFRFLFVREGPPKAPEALARYRNTGSGTVRGEQDPEKAVQIDFWETVARDGIADEAARRSALKFRDAFTELEERLGDNRYLLGSALSVLDIAWFIYADRLMLTGYPIAALHPRIGNWFEQFRDRPEFAKEVEMPGDAKNMLAAARREQEKTGKTLSEVAGF
ncbi:MAG: glutathione S-transferase family protein [Gammaproteobacteria bacterium]|nr:glutathione S-transferase family protein [Gammaproteobacteria bacterium]